MTTTQDPTTPTRPAAAGTTLHRSGAVARMLRMPVATLRVWERRYRLTQATLSPSGQRLYSADDVRRLALIKQLVDLGHAIGSLAALDMAELQRVAATHAQVLSSVQAPSQPPWHETSGTGTWQVVVIGAALGARLRRAGVLRRIGRRLVVLGPFADAQEAAVSLSTGPQVDAVLLHQPQLSADSLHDLRAAAPTLAGRPVGIVYGFAPEAVCEALADSGAHLLREPQPDVVLGQWLVRLFASAAPELAPGEAPGPPLAAIPPRRWGDAALADFAGLSTTVACECPRHLAELLSLLSQFEAYSAQCGDRGAADAELHAYLGRVAGQARVHFEVALERVAVHEGLMLPRTG